jgi:hypothetical protein
MKKSVVLSSVLVGVTAVALAGTADASEQKFTPAARAAAPVASVASVKPLPAIKSQDASLTYVQAGRVVTITKGKSAVATVTLVTGGYAKHSARAVLSVQAARPFIVDPAQFTLYDAQGWENDAKQTAPVRFEAGTGKLTLTFVDTPARPEALGWVAQDGDAVAVWER